MTNYLLMFDNQKIILYANKKNTPSRDGYMITQIKRSFFFVNILPTNLYDQFKFSICSAFYNLIYHSKR